MAWSAKGAEMGFDHRRIQTAVEGHAESDEPVNCPIDAHELDAFRAEYRGLTFWCGVLLGGCGGELRTKRYLDRVCHFSHRPDPDGLLPECSRRSRGVGSADHLYVKRATQTWLQQQGHAPRYHFHNHDDAPIGSLVDIELDGHRLRIHIDPAVEPDWDPEDASELILGPGVRIDPVRLVRRGYVNRVRFDNDGNRRVMQFGTELPHVGTDWGFCTSECEVTPEGLLKTPVVARIWHTQSRPSTMLLPAQSESPETTTSIPLVRPASPAPNPPAAVGTLIRRLNTAVRDQQTLLVRDLCRDAEREMSRCQGLALDKLQAATTAARTWLSDQDHLRRLVFTRLKEAEQNHDVRSMQSLLKQIGGLLRRGEPASDGEAALIAAAHRLLPPPRHRARRVSSLEAEARHAATIEVRNLLGCLNRNPNMLREKRQEFIAQLTLAVTRAGEALSQRLRRKAMKWINSGQCTPLQAKQTPMVADPPKRTRPSRPVRQSLPNLSPEQLESAAKAVRGTLKKAAREQTTTSWSRLQQQLGSALPQMSMTDRIEVLILVDRSTPADHALLSSLIAAGDPDMTAHYRPITAALGLDPPTDDDDLRDVIDADVQQAFDDWRHQ